MNSYFKEIRKAFLRLEDWAISSDLFDVTLRGTDSLGRHIFAVVDSETGFVRSWSVDGRQDVKLRSALGI